MHVEEMTAAISRADGSHLNELARALWAAHAAGQIGDDDAQALSEAIQARRKPARQSGFSSGGRDGPKIGGVQPDAKRRPVQRPRVRSEAIERRRRLAASGPMPPALAARFTTGELAVMRIVGDECAARGTCTACIDAIAARAGVSRTKAKQAIREACRLGMLERQEHRRAGAKSLPNTLRIVDREWLAWMKRGKRIGGTSAPTTDNHRFKRGDGLGGQPRAREGRHSHNAMYGTGIGPSRKCPKAFEGAKRAGQVEGQ
jgi:hypothetical protein